MLERKEKAVTIGGIGIIAGIMLYIVPGLYPGPFRCRNLPQAVWSGDTYVVRAVDGEVRFH